MDKHKIDSHKLHYHLSRVRDWQDGKIVYPIYVEISPVGHCNHRCTFCAVDYIGYKVRSLDVLKLEAALTDMSIKGVRSVMFAGEGEPLLHIKLPHIIQYAHATGIDCAITTNGVALTQKFVDSAIHYLHWIKVSMNGGPKSYTQVHQAGERDYERVWTNLEYAVKKSSPRTVIGLQCVVLPENKCDLLDLTKRARDTGLDYIVFKPYSQHLKSVTTEYKGLTYTSDERMFRIIESLGTDRFEVIVRRKTMENLNDKERGYEKCYSTPYFWAYIMATGDVYGCSAYLEDERFRFGNINTESFSSIWVGSRRRKCIDFVGNELCIDECRKNCRMDKVNRYLWDIEHPDEHENFI